MPFRPNVADKLSIDGVTYQIAAHPAALTMPYGQTGRRGTVYQLVASQQRSQALKVFTQAFRSERTASTAQRLRSFAHLPGLQVCERQVFTPGSHGALIEHHPDLAYAVLMPWVVGDTWQELVLDVQELSRDECHQLAISFIDVLATMERHHLAHCDLAAPNVLVMREAAKLALVDVEELYGPDLPRPEKLPGGTPGYAHKTAPLGLWSPEADRFAGAILLLEMLAWCDPRVRKAAYGEHYFDPDEMQTSSERYDLLRQSIRRYWGPPLEQLMETVWHSQTLANCPSMVEWQLLLSGFGVSSAFVPSQASKLPSEIPNEATSRIDSAIAEAELMLRQGLVDQAMIALSSLYQSNPSVAAPAYARSMLVRAILREEEGRCDLALEDYNQVLQLPALQEFRTELEMIVKNLSSQLENVEAPEQISKTTVGPVLGWDKTALQPVLPQDQKVPPIPEKVWQPTRNQEAIKGKPSFGTLRMRGNHALRNGNSADALICYRIAMQMADSDNLEQIIQQQLAQTAAKLRPSINAGAVKNQIAAETVNDDIASEIRAEGATSGPIGIHIVPIIFAIFFIVMVVLLVVLSQSR